MSLLSFRKGETRMVHGAVAVGFPVPCGVGLRFSSLHVFVCVAAFSHPQSIVPRIQSPVPPISGLHRTGPRSSTPTTRPRTARRRHPIRAPLRGWPASRRRGEVAQFTHNGTETVLRWPERFRCALYSETSMDVVIWLEKINNHT